MLSDYLDTVREIERRIQKMEAHDLSHVNIPNAPAGTPPQFEQHINLMFDLIALAYQANMTRVFSMMMAAEVSNLTYNQIGVPDAFHPLSHHNNEQAKMDRLVKIQTYHTELFAKFLAKLAGHAGWRRHHAGSFHDPVRQQHEQQQCAQSLPAADRAGGRMEDRQGRPAPEVSRPDAAREHAADGARPRGRSAGSASATARASSRRFKMRGNSAGSRASLLRASAARYPPAPRADELSLVDAGRRPTTGRPRSR